MKNKIALSFIKIISVSAGFFGALSFMRAASASFDRYAALVYGAWFDFGIGPSVIWLAVCLGAFAYSVWRAERRTVRPPFKKMDYSLLVLLCGAGFYICAYILRSQPRPYWMSSRTAVIVLPALAYCLAALVLGELLAGLRDKTLMPRMYWAAFFKAYPVWRPMGFFTLLMLLIQFYLMVYGIYAPVRLSALAAVCLLTYFASFLLNLSKEYDRANAEKIRAERLKTELITNVSHDIKTPLTSIINYVDLLKNEELNEKAADFVRVLDKKSSRLKTLIDDLMEASKAGTGNVKMEMEKLNLSEIVGQVAGEFEDGFNDRGLTLVIRRPGDADGQKLSPAAAAEEPVFVNADSRHLYRALENLFSNAVKYALGGTRVFAEITVCDDAPRFTMQNTSEQPMDFINGDVTEQFMRGDKSRRTEGSGLGLYISKNLIELMGDKLTVSVSGDLFRVDILFN